MKKQIKTNRTLVPLNATTRGAVDQENQRVMNLNVVGQNDAKDAALAAIARARNPLRDKTRPVAVIYELGPSRSGKTLIAQMIARILHGNPEALVKINGGNYKERHEVARLIGAPPGYLGHKPGDEEEKPSAKGKNDKHAKLTQKNLDASRKGSECEISVVLIDEANLMHASFDDVLMSVMDAGELDMGNNDVTDFRNTIIIMTSNLGMDDFARKSRRRIGFRMEEKKVEQTHDEMRSTVMDALRDRYRPEWLNRVDKFIVFHAHNQEQLYTIVDMELEKFNQRMEAQLPRGTMFHLDVEDSAKRFLLVSSMADNGNIANLKRELQKHLIDGLGNLMESGSIGSGEVIVVRHDDGAKVLTFLLAEGESVGSDADSIDVEHETDESQDGLAMQRRLSREQRSGVKPAQFDVILEARTERSMIRGAAGLMQELEQVYGMTLLRHSYAKTKPWTFIATVEATPGQMEVFSKKETDAKIVQRTN